MRMRKIVVGLDFSAPSIAAARWVSSQFAPEAELILAHVIDLGQPPPFVSESRPPDEVIETGARRYGEDRLQDVATFLSDRAIRTDVRVGRPHAVLREIAEEVGADLIVVGPHGDRPHSWMPLGTTAERLVRTSRVPVLVAKEPRSFSPREILVPVDDISITPTLLEWAKDLAESFDASITLLHVISNAEYSHVASVAFAEEARGDGEAEEAIEHELRDEGIRWLEEIARTGIKRERVSAAVTFGKPGDAVVQMATTMGADLIVLGRRGRGQVLPALLGSTVRAVLNGAACPVLVVVEPFDELADDSA